jgi:glucose 1-dehydrogenase/3-oxoacyl-[acyl-carrier protein] reductase
MKLLGHTLLVTGASKGIGAAIALEAAREGANVIVNWHSDEAGAHAVAEKIRGLGRLALPVRADVGCRPDVEAMMETASREIGLIDLLVNNAGIALWKPFLELDEENWDRTLDTNLKSVFLCGQAVARRLVAARKKGSIVNISSIAASGALDCLVPYCASKGGMTLVTRAMATELAPYGIRVNALAPGTIDIKRNRDTDPDYPGNWETQIPSGRVGRPEEIARPVIFLLSDEASYVTGQTLWADGGLTSYVPMPRADFARQ